MRKEFAGGSGKPIQQTVVVSAAATENGFEGSASWITPDGTCSANLEIRSGTFYVLDFAGPFIIASITVAVDMAFELAAYLEALFRETVKNCEME